MHKSLTAALVITLGAGVALAQPAGVHVRQVAAPTADFSTPENFEAMPAGAGTVRKLVNQDIFSFSLANLSFEQEERFKLGNALFRKLWVSSPCRYGHAMAAAVATTAGELAEAWLAKDGIAAELDPAGKRPAQTLSSIEGRHLLRRRPAALRHRE